MSIRCNLGLHDWRYDGHVDDEDLPDGSYVFRWRVCCQRCHQARVASLAPRKENYIPPGGIEALPSRNGNRITFAWPPTDLSKEEAMLTCVRPGTREHGTLRDGSKPVRTACQHLYRDHGKVMYFGEGRYGFVSSGCRHCSCEEFMG